METAVKERLVGAVILVVLVVLVVPVLLSGPREPQPRSEPEANGARSVEIVVGDPGAEPASDAQDVVPEAAAVLPGDSAPVPEAPTGVPGVPDPDPATVGAEAQPAPGVPSEPRPREAAAAAGAGWAVQVAALSRRDVAEQRVADLKRRGYPAFLLEYRADGRVLYRVRVGPETTRERADRLAERMKAEGVEGMVVAHP